MTLVDSGQLQVFIGATFRYASPGTFVSLRSFYDDKAKNGALPFPHEAVRIGDSLDDLIARATTAATRAAQHPDPVVFCSPVASFTTPDTAAERDLADVLTVTA